MGMQDTDDNNQLSTIGIWMSWYFVGICTFLWLIYEIALWLVCEIDLLLIYEIDLWLVCEIDLLLIYEIALHNNLWVG